MSEVVRKDRYGRDVRLDTWGMAYVRDEDGFAFYITPCCDASAKGMEWGISCRGCYQDIDPSFGGVPEPFEEDMTEEQKEKLRKWNEWQAEMVRKALGNS